MKLTYKFNIKKDNSKLLEWFQVSKNLYNQANYIIKKELRENNKWLRYDQLDKIMKTVSNLENEINYYNLKSQTNQQILRLLDKNWVSYFKSIKDWKNNPSKYKGMPISPKYLKRKENLLIFTNQNSKIKDNIIYLSKDILIQIPKYEGKDFSKFQQIRLLPRKNKIEVEIIYNQEVENKELNYNKYASIDLGLNNLCSLVIQGKQPFLISGKPLKSVNQWWNKRVSCLKSIKDKMKIKGYTKQLNLITESRNTYVKDYLHKVSRFIINNLVENEIGILVVGKNDLWKTQINLGKRNNQAFVSISHAQLLNYLKYKCELVGIKIIFTEESYTSKCDALALELLCKHEDYCGKRVKRGLFQSSIGKLINADINGALNILRKVVGDSDIKQIINSGLLYNPIKVRNMFSNPLYNF